MSFATDDMIGLEKKIHSLYADARVNGEWFLLSDEDVEQLPMFIRLYNEEVGQ